MAQGSRRPDGAHGWALPVAALAVLLAAGRLLATRLGPTADLGLQLVLLLAVALAARYAGMSREELALAPGWLRRGARVAAPLVGVATVAYLLALAVPATRELLLDTRYRLGVPAALLTAVVLVPLRVVLVEELVFRGLLWGLLARRVPARAATGWSAAAFGLWHVLPALTFASASPVGRTLPGAGVRLVTVGATVLATGAAGVLLAELRRRSRSLLAPIAVHWAVNGLGVLAAAAAWELSG